MNICQVISAKFPPTEGMGNYVWNLSLKLKESGHQVDIITRRYPGETEYEEIDGIKIWRVFFIPLYPIHIFLHTFFVNQLIRKIGKKFDIFHIHSPLPPIVKASQPKLLTMHVPLKADVATIDMTSIHAVFSKLQLPFSMLSEKATIKHANGITTVSLKVAEDLKDYGIAPQDVEVMFNAVNINQFKPASERQGNYVFTAARLNHRKGLSDLIDAAKIVVQTIPDLKFKIAGEGPLESVLQNKIKRLGLEDHVHLIGVVKDRNEIVRLYQNAGIFVLPAYYEGLPTVVLEAMACATPVIATPVGGVPQVITHMENGILVPTKDPSRLANEIIELYKDRLLQRRLGEQGRKTIEQEFSWEKISKKYLDAYENLLN